MSPSGLRCDSWTHGINKILGYQTPIHDATNMGHSRTIEGAKRGQCVRLEGGGWEVTVKE